MKKTGKRLWTSTVRWLVTLLAFMPLIWLVYQRWPEVNAALAHIDWLLLALATVFLFLVMPFNASMSWVSLRSLGEKISIPRAFALYFVTQIAKYLPGGVWAFPGRMLAYQATGVEAASAMVSVFREVSALFLGAVLIGLLALFQQVALDPALQSALAVGLLACLGATASLQLRPAWKLAARLPIVKNTRLAHIATQGKPGLFSLRWLPGALGCSLFFWLAMGLPFRQLMLALSPAAASISWLQAASLFALSWSIGFVVVFVPAGFGVRESALTLLLSSRLPVGDAVSIALLSRLWWMAVEGVLIAISWRFLGDAAWWRRGSGETQAF